MGEVEGDSGGEDEEVGVEGGSVDWIEEAEVREDRVGERLQESEEWESRGWSASVVVDDDGDDGGD